MINQRAVSFSNMYNLYISYDSMTISRLGKLLKITLLVTVLIGCTRDRYYPISGTSEAFRYFGEGHAKGKFVIAMVQSN